MWSGETQAERSERRSAHVRHQTQTQTTTTEAAPPPSKMSELVGAVHHAASSAGTTPGLQRPGGMSALGGAEREELGVGRPTQRLNY